MLTKFISRIVDFCLRFPRSVVIAGILIAIFSSFYTATHFAITSDIDSLLSKDLPWRQRGLAFENAFKRFQIIDAVIVRSLLAPALVSVLDKANWWMPTPVARILRVPDSREVRLGDNETSGRAQL